MGLSRSSFHILSLVDMIEMRLAIGHAHACIRLTKLRKAGLVLRGQY